MESRERSFVTRSDTANNRTFQQKKPHHKARIEAASSPLSPHPMPFNVTESMNAQFVRGGEPGLCDGLGGSGMRVRKREGPEPPPEAVADYAYAPSRDIHKAGVPREVCPSVCMPIWGFFSQVSWEIRFGCGLGTRTCSIKHPSIIL